MEDEAKECVCGNPMTAAKWKGQWVCHRCGRTELMIEQTDDGLVVQPRLKRTCDVHDALLYAGWDEETAIDFLNSIPDAK